MAYERGTASLFSLGVLLIQIFASDSQSVVRSKGVKLGHQNGTSRGVYLITSSDVTVRVGEQLQLNCTVVGADNSSKYQLSWYHGKQKLGENVIAKLRNNTVQVNIDAVDWNKMELMFVKKLLTVVFCPEVLWSGLAIFPVHLKMCG